MENKRDYWNAYDFSENFSGEFAIKCQYCGRLLTGGEGYYQRDGKPYCEECVESADLEDLLRICETETDELYRSVGLAHAYVSGNEA